VEEAREGVYKIPNVKKLRLAEEELHFDRINGEGWGFPGFIYIDNDFFWNLEALSSVAKAGGGF